MKGTITQTASASIVATTPHGPVFSANSASHMIASPMCALSVHSVTPTTAANASSPAATRPRGTAC